MAKFSVCMSVYNGDNAHWFKEAVDSIIQQSIKPNEIILVVDGPVGEDINEIIYNYEKKDNSFKVIRLIKNSGHAKARQAGIENAQYEYIAIMDSDDIAVDNRFEKQLNYFEIHSDCDILGGQIVEFVDNPSNIVGRRNVPLSNNQIYNYMKKRCAFNQPSVMFRKSAVLSVGGYQEWYCNEDYYLWIRMALQRCSMANLPDVLVYMRTGRDQYARRGGKKYFLSEKGIQRFMLDNRIISLYRYCFNVVVRWGVQVAMPNWLRGFVFQKLFRK